MRFLYQVLANAVAIIVASRFIAGFGFAVAPTEILPTLLWVSFLITLVNFFLKPILKLITGPIIFLTLGFFTIVINMFLLYLVDYLVPELKINGLEPLFWATILFGIVNTIFSILKK